MKEAYVKPTVKSEILRAEVLCDNCGSGSTCPDDGGTWFLGFPRKPYQ